MAKGKKPGKTGKGKQTRMAPIDWTKVTRLNNLILDIESNIEDFKEKVKDLNAQRKELLKDRKVALGVADDEIITGDNDSGTSKASHTDEHLSEADQAAAIKEGKEGKGEE